jgi:molecular chaperone GrpE (heat shock protein)
VVASAANGPGEVVAEVRRGYRLGDELLRVAEVVVNKTEDLSK